MDGSVDWFLCKYCRRVFQSRVEMSHHKLSEHRHQIVQSRSKRASDSPAGLLLGVPGNSDLSNILDSNHKTKMEDWLVPTTPHNVIGLQPKASGGDFIDPQWVEAGKNQKGMTSLEKSQPNTGITPVKKSGILAGPDVLEVDSTEGIHKSVATTIHPDSVKAIQVPPSCSPNCEATTRADSRSESKESKKLDSVQSESTTLYACFACDLVFNRVVALTSHLQIRHRINMARQRFGDNSSDLTTFKTPDPTSEEVIRDQMNSVSSSKEKPTNPVNTLTLELKNNPKRPKLTALAQCKYCFKWVISSSLVGHERVHTRDLLRCSMCSRRYQHKSSLYRHQKKKHRRFSSFSKGATGEVSLLRVTKTRQRLRDEVIFSEVNLNRPHLQTTSARDCGITYRRRESRFENHIRIEKEKKNHQCTLCSIQFSRRASLRTHIKNLHKVSEENINYFTRKLADYEQEEKSTECFISPNLGESVQKQSNKRSTDQPPATITLLSTGILHPTDSPNKEKHRVGRREIGNRVPFSKCDCCNQLFKPQHLASLAAGHKQNKLLCSRCRTTFSGSAHSVESPREAAHHNLKSTVQSAKIIRQLPAQSFGLSRIRHMSPKSDEQNNVRSSPKHKFRIWSTPLKLLKAKARMALRLPTVTITKKGLGMYVCRQNEPTTRSNNFGRVSNSLDTQRNGHESIFPTNDRDDPYVFSSDDDHDDSSDYESNRTRVAGHKTQCNQLPSS